jgi:hypothetical protein
MIFEETVRLLKREELEVFIQEAAVFEEITTSEDTEKLKIEVTDKGETLEKRILYSTLKITDLFGETRRL